MKGTTSMWWQLKHFWNFHPEKWGRFPIWRAYFSDGLKPTTNQIPFQKFVIFRFHFLLQRCILEIVGGSIFTQKLIKQIYSRGLLSVPTHFCVRRPQFSPLKGAIHRKSIHPPDTCRRATVQVACATGWHLLFMAKFLWSCQPCIQRDSSGTVTCCKKLTWILKKKGTRLVTHVTLKRIQQVCTQKWMVGRRSFPFGMAYFQGLC